MNEETKDDSQTQPETEDENNKSHLTPDFFYDDLELLEQSPTKSQFDDNYQISYVYGFDLNKRYNAIPVDEDTLLLSAGNFSFFLDISNSREYIINGHDKGVNCIAVHPKGKYVAIGEIGDNPSIYIYQFRNKKLYRILKGGTESAFTALNFSADGTMLASVGTYPDYTLTIWDWEKETLLLRSKAFSQDVFRVTFSETLKGNLTTSGVGHIRFWEMAHTFTGLKLQGEIGKFGNIEISDISGYSMFPDGKVLSGSENGNLLLWQDSIVKCEFRRSNGKSCHNGMIESVFHKGHDIITGGKDGVIRVWDFSTIDTAETDDTTIPVNLTMKSKLRINENASIKCMHMLGNEYLIVDSNSGIYKADLSKKEVTNIQKFHSGSINTISFSPNEPMFVTGGEDGYLRIWDINENKMINEIKFECSITKIYWPSLDIDMNGTTLYVGFKDGCLRVLLIGKNGIILKQPLKPHTKAIRDIAKSPITKMLATTGDDGSVFFFAIESELVPLGFTYINGKKPNTKEEITQAAITGIPIKDDKEYSKGIRIRWSDVVSIECSDGTIASVSPPSLIPNDNNESYYLDIPIEILQNGKIDEDITSFCMRDEGDVIGKKDGCIVFDNYSKKIHSSAITAIAFSNDDIWLVTGSSNGELFLFKRSQIKTRIFTPLNLKDINMELIPKVNDIKKDDYSIEEEKQKSELDKRIQEAEKKKELIKQKIEEKRKEFNSIVEENNKAPNYMKLGLESFKIDPFMYDIQEKKSKELEKDASNSTMWEAEKSRVSLNKVKERLLRNIEEESFKVSTINGEISVESFRIIKLDSEVIDLIQTESNTNTSIQSDIESSTNETSLIDSSEKSITEKTDLISISTLDNNTIRNKRKTFSRLKPMKNIVHTPNEHLKMRQKRDERKKAIMDMKPPLNYSDPDDLRAIEIAKNTIGDYKLKDDSEYIAPEEERINATKKRKQIMRIQNAIQDLKLNFNDKLKNLYELKTKLIKSINDTNQELENINLTIGTEDNEFIKYHIDNNSNIVKKSNEKIQINLPTPEILSFNEQVAIAAKKRIDLQMNKQKQSSNINRRNLMRNKQNNIIINKKKSNNQQKYSEIELIEQNEMKINLIYRRKTLISRIKNAIKKFDQKVVDLIHEKVSVNATIELAELRLVLMYREFKLLAKLEMKDHELNSKLKEQQKLMNDIDAKVEKQTKNLKRQEQLIEDAQKDLRKITKKFDLLVDSSSKFHDQLQKIFSFNIRRNAKKNESDEIDVDISTLDVDAVKKMFEAQSMEKEEDTCPQGCDPALFDKVLDLRESKMDIVDKITAAQTTKEKIKHECDSIQFKRKGLETSFCQIKQEFEEFQHEKQRHLNDLNFSMSLQFHQIQNLESTEVQTPKGTTITKGLPSDLSRSLVFTNSGLKRLQQQEQNLKNDRAACITMMKGNIAKFHEDQKEKEKIRQMIAAQQKKLLDIQQLKFGQSVDLVTLESMKVNPEADKIKETIKEVESKQNDEMNKILNKIEEAKETLNAEIQRNTALLNNLATLTEQQSEIEHVLQSPRRNQTADEFKQDLGLANPDELLSEYVKNDELIDKLNEEIGLLKRR